MIHKQRWTRRARLNLAVLFACTAVWRSAMPLGFAQSTGMPGIENSVGYLASGTSIQPKTTSESSDMIHGSIRGWTTMLHANAFLVDVQQSGIRGRDKLFSTNWLMPMINRQFGR